MPEIGINVPKALFLRALGFAKEAEIAPSRQQFEQRQKNVRPILEHAADTYHIGVVWPGDALCRGGYCTIETNGRPAYEDDNHLSYYGAVLIDPVIEKIVLK